MRVQRYYIIILFLMIILSSCSIIKKSNCDCPDFTKRNIDNYPKKI